MDDNEFMKMVRMVINDYEGKAARGKWYYHVESCIYILYSIS